MKKAIVLGVVGILAGIGLTSCGSDPEPAPVSPPPPPVYTNTGK